MELHSKKDVIDFGIVTDREFVLTFYPKAFVTKFAYYSDCWLLVNPEFEDNWARTSWKSEDDVWNQGKQEIGLIMLKRFER
jgi:hypothetical protein